MASFDIDGDGDKETVTADWGITEASGAYCFMLRVADETGEIFESFVSGTALEGSNVGSVGGIYFEEYEGKMFLVVTGVQQNLLASYLPEIEFTVEMKDNKVTLTEVSEGGKTIVVENEIAAEDILPIELKTDKIAYSKSWTETDSGKVFGGDAYGSQSIEVKAEGKRNRYAYVLSFHSADSGYHHSCLAVETRKNVFFLKLSDGDIGSYYDDIQACDVDGDGVDEILLNQTMGLTGGAGFYLTRIFRASDTGIEEIYNSNADSDRSNDFEFYFKDGCALEVRHKATSYTQKAVICSVDKYEGLYYDKKGNALAHEALVVFDSYCEFEPVDEQEYFQCKQYASLYGHSDNIGYIGITLKWDSRESKFETVDAKFYFYGSDYSKELKQQLEEFYKANKVQMNAISDTLLKLSYEEVGISYDKSTDSIRNVSYGSGKDYKPTKAENLFIKEEIDTLTSVMKKMSDTFIGYGICISKSTFRGTPFIYFDLVDSIHMGLGIMRAPYSTSFSTYIEDNFHTYEIMGI